MFIDPLTGDLFSDERSQVERPISQSIDQSQQFDQPIQPEITPSLGGKPKIIDPFTGDFIEPVKTIQQPSVDTFTGDVTPQPQPQPQLQVQPQLPQPAQQVKKDESSIGDYLMGSMVELPPALFFGATLWPVSQVARFGTIFGQKLRQLLDEDVQKMSPQEQKILGENVANYVQTLGGLVEPKTVTGKKGVETVGKIIEPIQKLGEWAAQGIDETKYPNLNDLIATGVEFGVFLSIPKVAKQAKKVVKKLETKRVEKLTNDRKKLLNLIEKKVSEGDIPNQIKDKIQQRRIENQRLIDSKVFEKPPEEIQQQLISLVKKTPQLSQQIKKILKSERGALDLTIERKKLISDFVKLAEESGMNLEEFMRTKGFDKKQIKEFTKLQKQTEREISPEVKLERLKTSGKEIDPFKLNPGEAKGNIWKGNNPNINVSKSMVDNLFKVPRGKRNGHFTPTDFMFDKYPQLKPLLNTARRIKMRISKDKKVAIDKLKLIEKAFPNKKLREELGAYWLAQTKSGKEALDRLGIEVNPNPKYLELQKIIQPLLTELFGEVSNARTRIGKAPIRWMEDFLPFIAKDNLLTNIENLFKDFEEAPHKSNFVFDSAALINEKQKISLADETVFRHIKRGKLRRGVTLERDPLILFQRYLTNSLDHIHMSPLNAYIKELMNTKKVNPKTGKDVAIKRFNPGLEEELSSWGNKLAGRDNLIVNKRFSKLVNKTIKNLTVAQLFGSARTMLVQATPVVQTAARYGMKNTAKGIDSMIKRDKSVPVEKSRALNLANMDASINALTSLIGKTKPGKLAGATLNVSAYPMRIIDYAMREITFRTAWKSLEPLIKKGKLTETEAINIADSGVIRTQASGAGIEVSPVQRNVLGRGVFLWNTFTIANLNFIAKDVLGIKNPELKQKQAVGRTLKLIAGMMAVNTLFEQGLGIQSPFPAPEQVLFKGLRDKEKASTITYKMLLEFTELIPLIGAVKFGEEIGGPVFNYLTDIAQAIFGDKLYNETLIQRAMGGDERAMIELGELVGKTLGVPATAQVAKILRGLQHGKSLPESIIGTFREKKKKTEWDISMERRLGF
jgi:hypothetical protein